MSSDQEVLNEEPLTITLHPDSLIDQSEYGMSYRVIQVESKEEPPAQDNSLSPILQSPSEYGNNEKTPLMHDSLDGEFYVIKPGPQVFTTVSCIPVAHSSKQKHTNAMRVRDEKKKESHKEVERRRRDKINNWILKLGELIPPDGDIQDNNVDISVLRSKSLILAKACNYIGELKSRNENLSRHSKTTEQLISKLEKLSEQNSELQYENTLLKSMLVENGLLMDPNNMKSEDDSNPS